MKHYALDMIAVGFIVFGMALSVGVAWQDGHSSTLSVDSPYQSHLEDAADALGQAGICSEVGHINRGANALPMYRLKVIPCNTPMR